MMTAAEWHREFVANFSAKRPVLCKAHMMRIGRRATANQAGLLGDEPYMLAIANSARFRVAEFALVDLRCVGPSSRITRFDFARFANLAGIFEFRELLLERLFDPLGISCNQCVLVR